MWDKVRFYWSKTNRWHRVLLLFLIVELRLVPAGQMGFWCNDPALSHPFTGDTVNWKWLLVTTAFLPIVVMLLAERKYHKNEKSKSQALSWYKEYLFGLLINVTVVQTIKLFVGSPRPHFFDTCQPVEASSCQGSEYVSRYTCAKAVWQHQSDKSFPSGHTSLALHAAVFIAYYLHRRTAHTKASWGTQTLFVLLAVGCAVSRVWDRRHHWGDVAAGAALSAPVLLYTIFYLCKNFDCPETSIETTDPDDRSGSDHTSDSQSRTMKLDNNVTLVHT